MPNETKPHVHTFNYYLHTFNCLNFSGCKYFQHEDAPSSVEDIFPIQKAHRTLLHNTVQSALLLGIAGSFWIWHDIKQR